MGSQAQPLASAFCLDRDFKYPISSVTFLHRNPRLTSNSRISLIRLSVGSRDKSLRPTNLHDDKLHLELLQTPSSCHYVSSPLSERLLISGATLLRPPRIKTIARRPSSLRRLSNIISTVRTTRWQTPVCLGGLFFMREDALNKWENIHEFRNNSCTRFHSAGSRLYYLGQT